MSLKIIKSSLFDHPQGTTQKLQLNTIVHEYKQKLRLNSQSTSRIVKKSVEQLNAVQARSIEKLTQKSKTITFHQVYQKYQKIGKRNEKNPLIDPQKFELFQKGLRYRCAERPKTVRLQSKIKEQLQQYFHRKPEEQNEAREFPSTIVFQKLRSTQKNSKVFSKV